MLATTIAYVVIWLRIGGLDASGGDPILVLIPFITAAAAMLILASRPRNPIGWLLLVWALGDLVVGSGRYPIVVHDHPADS